MFSCGPLDILLKKKKTGLQYKNVSIKELKSEISFENYSFFKKSY